MQTKLNQPSKKEPLRRVSLMSLIVALFLVSTTVFSQTTVNSLSQLLPYLDDNNVNIKLAPGTYWITEADAKNGLFNSGTDIIGRLSKSLLLFEGNNSTYDFTGVTINIETQVFQAYGSSYQVYEVHTIGNGNVIKNLTLVDVGSVHDNPAKGANSIVMDGKDNRIEGFHVTIKGSYPYGYGDSFGKGGNPVIGHKKHSACLIRGESNHVKDCTFIHRSYGHCIYMQAASNPIIEGCYVEGEMRSTDDMLREEGSGSPADDVNFMTVWGYRLPAGYMMSTGEGGIRAYNAGETVIDGVEYSRGTSNPTILNCVIKNMRTGVTLTHASGTKYVEGTSSIGCEQGFAIGSGSVVNCYADAAYGPVYQSTYNSDRNFHADITILTPENGYYNGSKSLAYIGGSDHNIVLRSADSNINSDLKIEMGGIHKNIRFLNGSLPSQHNHEAEDIELENYTGYSILLPSSSSGNDIQTCGAVTNNGSGNSISYVTCNNTPTCTTHIADITPPSNLVSGINYAYYEGTWDNLPNFDALTALDTGITSAIDLNNATSANYFGFTFDGYINVSTEGEYTFYTASDDGSALWIGNNQVVDNDGLHGMVEKSGTICLEAGYHKISVAYFEKTGGNSLTVSYAGPGISKTTLSNLYAQGETNTEPGDFPDPNKTYYIDAPHHNLRLAATGESEDAYTTSTNTTGADVEWKFVDRGNGYWHVQRAAGGSKPRLRTDQSENADMQPTSSRGTWTYFDFTEGAIEDTYFLTLPAVTTEFKRLQIDRDGVVKMVGDDRNGTWESFRITEVGSTIAEFTRIEAEDYDAMSGIQTEGSTESGENVGWINDEDWLRFDDIDLTGAQSMEVRIACNFTGGIIEIRTGSVTGPLIGSTSVTYTGGNQDWVTLSASINNVSGVQDVYLVFKGGSGYLFNINWLEFSAETINSKSVDLTNQALIYPTLIEDIVNIKLNTSQSSAVIDIINISGQIIASKNIINNDVHTMNLEDIPSGLYIMKITDLEGIKTRKIIKK